MYQAPPPTNQALLRQADRYALAIGALAGLIDGLLYTFDIWPGNILVNTVIRMAATALWVLPYVLIDDLVAADWFARIRRLTWIYGGLAGMALLLRLISPQPFRWLPGSIIIVGSMLAGAGISLLLERRHVRPKL
jgi:hypothetical protein